ncbi:4-hydroxy-tetrahydrodipicolinate synthase [Macrococcus hajekii]|uniref:4-hydroxy-tetrahydrodipicolinate synthase n=1 Tax=Macrococcus hajekii TaxID=198482 RepID=A0A4R6BJF3_9STAP|nr:4-hydroxy-tetrahydrodipicolinate synthase [Macrococcus hajekii]TDM01750.1 4-hydroxy-tetrahydrodipicolinate synthase [Macrococcus hajekii]GGB07125.1 4-hydroxy-tetrahydrodipicolinate synthase [Macrococcus hajekii]
MTLFTGTAVAVTTPFKEGEVDYTTFEKHIEFLIDNGMQSIFVNGTTGEGSTLTEEEKLELVRLAVRVSDGRVPIVVGTGTNNTAASIEHSLKVKEADADAIMLITPYYNKTNQRGLLAHFTAIAEAVQLPVVLYNVPARTNMTIEPETIKILAEHPYIVALKDATGDMEYLKQVRAIVSTDFTLYSGNDDSIIPFYERGGDGVISVVANAVPAEFQAIYETYASDPQEAERLFNKVSPLIDALGVDVNPMPIKALVTELGFANGEVRLPLVPLEEEDSKVIHEAYQAYKGEA